VTSIIIPTTGQNLASLEELLSSIDTQQILPQQILICGNVYDRRLEEGVQHWRRKFARLSEMLNLSFTLREGINAARNQGIELSQGEILLFLDDDCWIPNPSFIYEHERLHRAHPEVTAIGGPYHLPANSSALSAAYHWNLVYWMTLVNTPEKNECFELLGGNMSFKKEKIGTHRFSEAIRFGGSETEFLYRLKQMKHHLLWEETLALRHECSMNFAQFLRKGFLQGYSFGRRLMNSLQIENPTDPSAPSFYRFLRRQGLSHLSIMGHYPLVWIFESVFNWGIEHSTASLSVGPPTISLPRVLGFRWARNLGFHWIQDKFHRFQWMLRALLDLNSPPVDKTKE
jgi:hypothetical protein